MTINNCKEVKRGWKQNVQPQTLIKDEKLVGGEKGGREKGLL